MTPWLTDRKARLCGLAGVVLLGAYLLARALLPDTGRDEFAYTPYGWEFRLIGGMRGLTAEQVWDHALRIGVLGPALLLVSVALARSALRFDFGALVERRVHVAASLLSVATIGYVMVCVLKGRPIVDDEITYATMGRILASGRLADATLPELPPTLFEIVTPRGITGKYLPGEPLVQMLGVALGIPALLHVPLCALTLWTFHRATSLLSADARIASWSTTFLALSPMFILCSATGHSQATALTCVTLAVLGYALAVKRGLARGGVLAGLAVAFGLLVRPQVMPVVALVLAIAFTWHAIQRRALGPWLGYALTSPLGIAAIVGYDYALSGEALHYPFYFMTATERWGFGPIAGPGTYAHTLELAFMNQPIVALRLNAWWLGWPLSLLLLTKPAIARLVWTHARVLIGLAAGIVAFQFGYYTTGISDVGAVYHFELLLPLSVWAAYVLIELARTKPRLAGALLCVDLVLGTGSFLIEQTSRLHRLIETIHAQSDRVLAGLPPHSLLLSETWCSEVAPNGWLLRGYPREVRDERANVIVHSRPEPEKLDALLARLPDRPCFYVHASPEGKLETLPCARARPALSRPLRGGPPCSDPISSASRLGWQRWQQPY